MMNIFAFIYNLYIYIYIYIYIIYISIYIYVIQVKKTMPLSKKYFDMMSSTVLLQLNSYLQKLPIIVLATKV